MDAERTLAAVAVVAVVCALAVVAAGAGGIDDRFEPNDGFDSAAEITDGSYENLSIEADDIDYYAIDVETTTRLEVPITFDHDVGDLDLALYNGNRSEIASSTSLRDVESVRTLAEPGTYYVRVRGFRGETAPYSMVVRTDAIDDIRQRFEPDDTFNQAGAIDVPTSVQGFVAEDDVDYYGLSIVRGERARVSLTADNASTNLTLRAFDPDTTRINESATDAPTETVTVTAEEAGTYYVSVSGYLGATGEYTLNTSDTAPADPSETTNATPTTTATPTVDPVPTPNATPTDTPAVTPNATPTDTPAMTSQPTTAERTTDGGSGGGLPVGAVPVLFAVIACYGVVRRLR
ncbi:hypothetical protein BRD17_01935 [Halobacteriales archaeon SW_7_68_16]|nr:MAG: hypothetical protein BRD17_01935 [Halobacteriales archaeon SW_7_68_16]